MAPVRLLAIVTDPLAGEEAVEEIRRRAGAGGGVRVIAPAVPASAFQHALGDVDEPAREARRRLHSSLAELRRHGIAAEGAVGDSDPVLAAEDALRREPAAEVLIFERDDGRGRWFESGLFERAQEALEPPLRVVRMGAAERGEAHVVGVEEAGPGRLVDDAGELELSENLPRFGRRDLAGVAVGILGTIAAAVLAAVAALHEGAVAGAGAAAILIAIGVALVNLAHVVGLTLFQSVHYRGGWERFFGSLALVGTPLAVAANALIALLG